MTRATSNGSALNVNSALWKFISLVAGVSIFLGLVEGQGLVVMSQNVAGSVDSPSGEKQVTWGLADTTADVGKIFEYTISKDAFSEDVKECTVTEVGSSTLPSWLYYNTTTHVIEGLALEDDLIKQSVYLIQVTATLTSGSSASDSFSIHLKEYCVTASDARKTSTETNGKLPSPIYCPLDSSVTSASVILNVNIKESSAEERVRALRLLGHHVSLSENALRYVSVNSNSMIDSAALVAGPGDETSASGQATAVRWEVGCGSVLSPHMDILLTVESSAKDGSLHNVVSYGIIGWYVTNKKSNVGSRIKRQARVQVISTPTLARTVAPPSSRPVPTRIVPSSSVIEISPTPSKVIEPTRTRPTKPPTTTSTPTRHIIQPSVPYIESKSEPSKTTSLPAKPIWEDKSTQPDVKPTPSTPLFQQKHDLTVGDILNYAIPQHAFRSFPLGKFLIVSLVMSPGSRSLSNDSWIGYDDIRHVLFGIPSGKDVGRHEYQLIAYDEGTNQSEALPFEVVIRSLKTDSVSYETHITLDEDYDKFIENMNSRLQVASNIAAAYGDLDASSVSILRLEKGSVVYSWTNKTTNRDDGGCPAKEVNSLMDKVVTPGGKVQEPFLHSMKPFRVKEAGGEGRGVCKGVIQLRRGLVDDSFYKKELDPDIQPKTAQADSSLGLIIAIVVIIIAIIIVIVIVTIWCSKRKSRTKKYSCEDTRNGGTSKKGVPVILATDLDDRPLNGGGSRSKATVIRANTGSSDTLSADSCDRKPMPPGYSSPAISRADHSQPLLSHDERQTGGQQTSFKPYPSR